MVNILPASLKGFTSLKPTEAIVITVIYTASKKLNPSISIYPNVPSSIKPPKSNTGCKSPLKRFKRFIKNIVCNVVENYNFNIKWRRIKKELGIWN